jgi:hypothetical protein
MAIPAADPPGNRCTIYLSLRRFQAQAVRV